MTTNTSARSRRDRRPPTLATPKLAFSITEVCAALGISRPTYYKLVCEGQLHAVKVSGRVLIPAVELDRLLAPTKTAAKRH